MSDLADVKAKDRLVVIRGGGLVGIITVRRVTETQIHEAPTKTGYVSKWRKSDGRQVGGFDKWSPRRVEVLTPKHEVTWKLFQTRRLLRSKLVELKDASDHMNQEQIDALREALG